MFKLLYWTLKVTQSPHPGSAAFRHPTKGNPQKPKKKLQKKKKRGGKKKKKKKKASWKLNADKAQSTAPVSTKSEAPSV